MTVVPALALARLPLARVLRGPRIWIAVGGWALFALVAALAVRAQGQPSGADHVMRGAYGRFVFPLVAYVIVGAAVGGSGMRKGVRGVVGLGASPASAAVVTAIVSAAACAAALAVLSALVCAIAHGSADPPLARDLFASTWIGALGGAAYAAYFAAGSAIGKSGAGRGAFLAVDFIVAGGAGAVLTPHGHVASLFGGPLCADLSQRASSVLLVVLFAAYLALTFLLSRRVA